MRVHKLKKKNRKGLIALSVIISVVITAFVAYMIIAKPFSTQSTKSDQQQTQQSDKTEKGSSDVDSQTTTNDNTSTTVEGHTPVQYEGDTSEEDAVDQDNDRFRIPEDEE